MNILHAETVDLNTKDARARLAHMVMRLFEHWQLNTEDQLMLLGLEPQSRTTLARYRRGAPLASHRDLLDRVGHLLAMHKSLRILFPRNRELTYAWIRMPNRHFEGRTPVQAIRELGFMGLLMVRNYLDWERGR